jgi:hypothetical protein
MVRQVTGRSSETYYQSKEDNTLVEAIVVEKAMIPDVVLSQQVSDGARRLGSDSRPRGRCLREIRDRRDWDKLLKVLVCHQPRGRWQDIFSLFIRYLATAVPKIMKFALAGILTAAVGALGALAASSTGTYSAFQQELIGLAASHDGLIPLDAALFEKIISKDREYSVAVQFTAMSMKCAPCRYVYPHLSTSSLADC